MNKNPIWKLIPPPPDAFKLAKKIDVSLLEARLLINRGITDSESASSHLNPRLTDLADPMLLKDMDKAVNLILDSIKGRKRIAVYGDYDADGITATALLVNFFTEFGYPISSYIPNRLDEGYSLNPDAVKKLADEGVGLIITVDCGISNKDEVALAHDLGMEIIITDHHQIPEGFKPLCPVINPHRSDSIFPFKELAGVGVAFFLAIALRGGLRSEGIFHERHEPDLKQYLDLVALGTVADMVPLRGQNRVLVSSGIRAMKNSRWPGIRRMIEASHVRSSELSSSDLAFKLAPRLNAPGRMGDIESGIMGLTTNSESVAMDIVRLLNRLNIRRQEIEGNILDDIESNIIPGFDLHKKKIMVFARQGWHQGVLGIVASRLLDRYKRPVLVLTIKDQLAVGSGRSINGFNLQKAMERLDPLFEKYGGHYHAAGCTIKASNLKRLIKGLEEIADEILDEKDMVPSIDIDAAITLKELTMDTITRIGFLAPFGKKNPEPLFYGDSLDVVSSRVVGENHLRLRVRQNKSMMEAIGFGLADLHPLEGKTINMVFTPEINSWNGFDRIQLRIIDLELKGSFTKLMRPEG